MKSRGSNPEREFHGAQNRSEEWVEDPVGRMYDDQDEDEPFEDEEEDPEDEDEEDPDDEDDYEEDEEEDEEEDDL